MDRRQWKESILKKIKLPEIPKRQYSVEEFGVAADSEEIQTGLFQEAIDEVSRRGGGRLVVPAGRYRIGSLELKSKVELHLEGRDTVLSFVNEEVEEHYPVVFCHWEASPCYNYSPLIYAREARDIALTGEGILDGGADALHWWNWHHQVEEAWSIDRPDLQLADRKLLRQMNMDGVPIEKRIFGPGHYLRPNFVQPVRCERILLQGFTLVNSPMWQLNPVMCKSLTVDGVTMSSHGSNNDGCDPESCDGVHIKNCRFDAGDDCISLKSGRDRDGREANIPCQNVVIEDNEFADGHGGVALGSEMSGGIRRVIAVNNRFSSPNLTYALRLKTNARRGGCVEDIVLADSVMEHVHGATVHGTMLYEDGRNGDDLPRFKNIIIENITARGGDYGIFLEAFREVPITGLVLRNIRIHGVARPMRSMNWKDPVLENIEINGKTFPRPCGVRILGVPARGSRLRASAEEGGGVSGEGNGPEVSEGRDSRTGPWSADGGQIGEKAARHDNGFLFRWQVSRDGLFWEAAGEGEYLTLEGDRGYVRVIARDSRGNEEKSRGYRILAADKEAEEGSPGWKYRRLACRGMLDETEEFDGTANVTRLQLARMMAPLAEMGTDRESLYGPKSSDSQVLREVIDIGFLAPAEGGEPLPSGHVTRQEMATVAMQACGVNYRNASSTMPVCADMSDVGNNYGTNVARALYFGFMELDGDGNFNPESPVTAEEAADILNRVADFAGL